MSATVLIVDDVQPLAEQYAFDLKRLGGLKPKIASGGAEGPAGLAKSNAGPRLLWVSAEWVAIFLASSPGSIKIT